MALFVLSCHSFLHCSWLVFLKVTRRIGVVLSVAVSL